MEKTIGTSFRGGMPLTSSSILRSLNSCACRRVYTKYKEGLEKSGGTRSDLWFFEVRKLPALLDMRDD
ncbi:hypothetical protein FVEG_16668 [Fusarium verticillioides 7600]|uniref:Uncharacterized protein n=1 Tax=Gibberella moniliformis (strain M3125 / FGSC 7600) TaxID=334819 RepID=W7MID5_GIBM7|nr:hypothetical protein FVEG_16668 [Fusarium verticillioides 7600]EWG50651.1 hypothetical protein FVEG_16668 [Fusarium verticillioides 7600]